MVGNALLVQVNTVLCVVLVNTAPALTPPLTPVGFVVSLAPVMCLVQWYVG